MAMTCIFCGQGLLAQVNRQWLPAEAKHGCELGVALATRQC
jgi:hypothetical protein